MPKVSTSLTIPPFFVSSFTTFTGPASHSTRHGTIDYLLEKRISTIHFDAIIVAT